MNQDAVIRILGPDDAAALWNEADGALDSRVSMPLTEEFL